MVYHWQSNVVKGAGVDDMVMLSRINNDAIAENLKKRFKDDQIYTYIGPVLISVNPFKMIRCYEEKHFQMYQGAVSYENPPHLYSLSDDMYRNMMIDNDNHCVIISGESGAGKTVAAKHIMQYVARVSGGGDKAQQVKNVILQSNPLLEAFGNAKTVRNNNSSRFGKYIEIKFNSGGQPVGGQISNFLLEKSRVTYQNTPERSFHIFYQLCVGASDTMKNNFGLAAPEYYAYLNQTGVYRVDDINDTEEFRETLQAMAVMGMSEDRQSDVLQLVSAILHLGNIGFEECENYARILSKDYLSFPAYLMGIEEGPLEHKLLSRVMESRWGGKSERVEITLNVEQAYYTRDAWAKAIYARLFSYLVECINLAMVSPESRNTIGILDIYGFEIFESNGFEQFCINFVNEKLQQIFIELTLRAEQEEYVQEGIQWEPIEFFDNKVVCELIEGKRPPGIMFVLDDVCAKMHAVTEGADKDFLQHLDGAMRGNRYYQSTGAGFNIDHYAGKVSYSVEGFCERNRDVLNDDIVEVMQSSQNEFVRSLFPEKIQTNTAKSRPTTSGTKIRNQAKTLVDKLMQCTPHYIRCIKPNETKKAGDWEDDRVKFQVGYLGLKENIRVRRAGFAYRRPFEKFLQRYSILSDETWPYWRGDLKKGISHILSAANITSDQFQMGREKIFIRTPETLFILEEMRERKFDKYAVVLQRFFQRLCAESQRARQRQQAADLFYGQKERRRHSINRYFVGDYIGLQDKPELLAFLGKREKVAFSETIRKYNRRFKATLLDLIVTSKYIYMIGREKMKKGPQKGQIVEVLKRKISLTSLSHFTVSPLQDDLVVVFVKDDYTSVLEMTFKSEFLSVVKKLCHQIIGATFTLKFASDIEYMVKKEGWGGGGGRSIRFTRGQAGDQAVPKISSKQMVITIGQGLDKYTKPMAVAVKRTAKTHMKQNGGGVMRTNPNIMATPPPPSQPAPLNQPRIGGNMNQVNYAIPTGLPRAVNNDRAPKREAPQLPKLAQRNSNPQNAARAQRGGNQDFMRTPDAGAAGLERANIERTAAASRPVPARKPAHISTVPKCKAVYSYTAMADDELTFQVDDVITIIQEDASGWWLGKLRGAEAFFPANYVQKLT